MITVRHATENDLPQILYIYNDIIKNTTAVYYYEPHTLDMRKAWFDERKKLGFPIFVAEEDGVIVGMSTIGPFRVPTAYKYSVENTVHVAANARGKGIGKSLLAPLIEAAKDLNMHTIIAGIDASNEVSLHLHKGFGFEEVAHFKQVGFKFDRWLDLKFLQLILTTSPPKEGNLENDTLKSFRNKKRSNKTLNDGKCKEAKSSFRCLGY